MALDPSTLLSRTTAGDAELTTPTNGLSLGQRKVLTYLESPQALAALIVQRALDAAKLDRDLAKLSALGLVAFDGQVPPRVCEAVVIGPVRSASMLRWLVPLLLLAGGAIAWLGFAGTASHKPATTAIGVAVPAPRPAATLLAAGGTSAAGATGAGIAGTRAVATDAPTVRNPAAAPDARRAGDARAASAGPRTIAVAPGMIARQPATSGVTEPLPSPATARTAGPASPASGTGGHAVPPADARNDAGSKAEPARAAGTLPGIGAAPTQSAPSGVASAPSNAAFAGSAATPPPPPPSASAPPVTLAMAAPGSAEARPHPPQKLVPLTREDPEFPREALSRGISTGTVKAHLSVDALGKVTAVSIVDARPARVFDRVVKQALSRWTFVAGEAARSTEVEIAFRRD